MSSINSDEIISILREEIENFDTMSKDSEVGTVVSVGDGIATIYGIDHAMYGEIITFETGLKGSDVSFSEVIRRSVRVRKYPAQERKPAYLSVKHI